MIISKIEIQDYRSCLNATFTPDHHLSVLIGPNGSGKTNVLNALLLLKKLAEEEPLHYRSERPFTARCRIKVWFDLNGKTVILTADIHTDTDDNNNDMITSSRQTWYMKDFTSSAKRPNIPLSLMKYMGTRNPDMYRIIMRRYTSLAKHDEQPNIPDAAVGVLNNIAKFLSEIQYYSASQFTNPSNCPVSFEIEKEGQRSRGSGLHSHAKFLFDLYTEFKAQSDRYSQFFDIVGPNGIGLIDDISFKDILTSSIDYSVRSGGVVKELKREKSLIVPQFTVGRHELSPNQLSEGTFKTITLLFYIMIESSSILLIEEPEVCVHHGLLSSIIELIKTYSEEKQIIISTHSDFVLDQVAPENVFKISNSPAEGTKIKHITKALSRMELQALREYLETDGNLGEYWRHGALEG